MSDYVVRRLGQMVVVALGVTVIVFAIVHLVPGDPILLAMGTRFDAEAYRLLYERAGFDDPLMIQYLRWLGSAVTGDLGVSFHSGIPVTLLILGRLPATVTLAGAALLIALLVALPAGVLAAVRAGSRGDYAVTTLSQVGVSIPNFWSALMLVLLFSLYLGWLPPSGYVGLLSSPTEWAKHLILPAVTMGLIFASVLTRFVRSAMLEQLNHDYVRTARAKGLAERTIVVRHVLRNALVPVVTVVGLQVGFLLSGVVVIEVVFAWPGLGTLAFDSVLRRDYPVLQGAVLVIALVFLLVNLFVDVLYSYLDPRIRY